jgi:hypothetical protein
MAGSAVSNVFKGPNGIRAGWRLLIFFAVILPLGYGAGLIVDRIIGPNQDRATPIQGTILMGIYTAALMIATWIMIRIEGRSFADYGLPWRRAFGKSFWQGAAISFASLALLLLVLRLVGVYSFGPLALHGLDILKYGAAWTVPLFISVVLEDFFYRGYLLFTLTTGIGFWPAAVITSLWMGGMHYFNPGGHSLGPVAATLYCLVTCLVIRRTGDLWMPMGIHAGWGWGVVFFFGLASSGFPGSGHLLNGSLHGATWLTGGEFGIEASVPNLILLALWGAGFFVWLRGIKYPNPAAVPDPRQQSAAFQAALDTFASEG